MLKVLHIATECYPAAKAGGMGDVVGALPIYSPNAGIEASVIIPKYQLKWFEGKSFKKQFEASFWVEDKKIDFSVLKLNGDDLPYPFYCIDMPGLFDRPSIYLAEDGEGFRDEVDRNFGFQRAVLMWLNQLTNSFDLIHCHDHQAGLIPFFMYHGSEFSNLRNIPTYHTIHNAAYHGKWWWNNQSKLPDFDRRHTGLLDWDNHIHSLAAAIKNCSGFNAVSPTYLKEISHSLGNLTWLFDNEKHKSTGILNGIDTELWNPKTDPFLSVPLKRSWDVFKRKNKEAFLEKTKLNVKLPLMGFIGRLAHQKGADILAEAIRNTLKTTLNVNFVILGSGSRDLENEIKKAATEFPENVHAFIMYNEGLAHEIYAACDFLFMPSRFEPCGLNQMFAMRYGTLPIVHATGGLIDTVTDIDQDGTGIRFSQPEISRLTEAIERGVELFSDKKRIKAVRKKAIEKDFSWTRSVLEYKKEYLKLIKRS